MDNILRPTSLLLETFRYKSTWDQLTHFVPQVSFYIILKTSENLRIFYVYRRYRKRPVALNGLNNEGEGELHEIKRSRGKMEIDKEIIW